MDREGKHYRLYHTTLIEFLTAKETRQFPQTQDLYLDEAIWHRKIVTYYRGNASTWEEVKWVEVDDYGLRFLAARLYALRAQQASRQDLYQLICKSFMREKYTRFSSHRPFAEDVELAIC